MTFNVAVVGSSELNRVGIVSEALRFGFIHLQAKPTALMLGHNCGVDGAVRRFSWRYGLPIKTMRLKRARQAVVLWDGDKDSYTYKQLLLLVKKGLNPIVILVQRKGQDFYLHIELHPDEWV